MIRFINEQVILYINSEVIYMAKKKKKYKSMSTESPTKDFRNVAQVTMGGGMAGMMMPLISAPTPGNINNAIQGSQYSVQWLVLGLTQ